MPGPFLSVVIPAYNEEKRIGASLASIVNHLNAKGLTYEVVVADDGCRDNTESAVKLALGDLSRLVYLKSGVNRGKGNAVKRGMLAARGDFALLTDADLSTPIAEIDKFLPHMTSPDAIVIGTRKSAGALVTRHQPWLRETMGKGFTLLTNVILGMHLSDFTCGFKVFGKAARERVFALSRIDRWGYDAEILFIARRMGYRIQEVPVQWENKEGTRVRLVRDTVRSIKELIEIRFGKSITKNAGQHM